MPTALDPTNLEFKGTTLERYLSNKERLIRLRSLLALSRGLRASHREGVGTSGWGRRRHLREPPTSVRPPGIPDATGCLSPQSRRQGPGALRLRARGTGLPVETSTLQSLGERLPATAARSRRGRVVNPKPPRAARGETTSPTGVRVKRRKEREGWKAGAGERTAGDGDGAG